MESTLSWFYIFYFLLNEMEGGQKNIGLFITTYFINNILLILPKISSRYYLYAAYYFPILLEMRSELVRCSN